MDAICFIANHAARSELSSFRNDLESCSEARDISAGGRKCRHSAKRSGGRDAREWGGGGVLLLRLGVVVVVFGFGEAGGAEVAEY